MRKSHGLRFLLSFPLLCMAALASAQNIAPNQNFDSGLPPWAVFVSSAPDPVGAPVTGPTWLNNVDINNNPSSGSGFVDINTSQPQANAGSGIAQCVDFASTAVSLVNYGIGIRVPSTTTTDASVNATVEMRLFSGAGCSGFITGGSQGRTLVAGLASDTNWYLVGDSSFVPPGAPVSAMSAQIRAYLREVNGGNPSVGSYQVDFDAAHLVLNSTTPVRLQQFEVD